MTIYRQGGNGKEENSPTACLPSTIPVVLQLSYSVVLWGWVVGSFIVKLKASKINDDLDGKGYGWWAHSSDDQSSFPMRLADPDPGSPAPEKGLTPKEQSMQRVCNIKDLHLVWSYFKIFQKLALLSLFVGPAICEIVFVAPTGSSTIFILANLNLFFHF